MRASTPGRLGSLSLSRPRRTSARFSPSSGARSATVPRATRSSSALFGKLGRAAHSLLDAQQALGQLEGHSHAGQILERVGTARLLGIDDGHGGRQRLADRVMVGDDQVQARPGLLDLVDRADAAVDGDDDAHARGVEAPQGVEVQAIALVHAVGDVGLHLRAQGRQGLDQQGRGGHAVGVKVAVDGDRLALGGWPAAGGSTASFMPFRRKGLSRVIRPSRKSRAAPGSSIFAVVEQLDDEGRQIGQAGQVLARSPAVRSASVWIVVTKDDLRQKTRARLVCSSLCVNGAQVRLTASSGPSGTR